MKIRGRLKSLFYAVAVLVPAAVSLAGCAGIPHAPPARTQAVLVIRDVPAVDVVAGTLRPHTSVTVVGTQITEVGPAAAGVPRDARVIEGAGRFLIPGLWDMHSHSLWSPEAMRSFLPVYVSQGVTGIRDMGGRLDVLSDYRTALKQGDVAWPRVFAAGQVLNGPDPVQADISMAVTDARSAAAAVDSLKLVRGRVLDRADLDTLLESVADGVQE